MKSVVKIGQKILSILFICPLYNTGKTQYLCKCVKTTDLKPQNSEVAKKCATYFYLGIYINTKGTHDIDITFRINSTRRIVKSLKCTVI